MTHTVRTFSVSISHIDTCAPDYLTDHHNREGEALVGLSVSGSTTWGDILEGLRDALTNEVDMTGHDSAEQNAIEAAFVIEIEDIARAHPDLSEAFDSSLEEDSEDDAESSDVQAWFLFTFEADEMES